MLGLGSFTACSSGQMNVDAGGNDDVTDEQSMNDVVTTDTVNDVGADTAPQDTGTHPDGGPCMPTSAHENTDALCSDGIDNDCNGYTDCDDYGCSRNSAVTVCHDAGMVVDSGPPGTINASGGTVNLLHFGVFGDVRPMNDNETSSYPTSIITQVMQGMNSLGAQFAVASGDYMFANTLTNVNAQIGLFLNAESNFSNFVFHGMGNHECTGATDVNCPNWNETPNILQYLARLSPDPTRPYADWTIHTSLGDAHFISTAPNAWNSTQQTWLTSALAQSATYTFVLAHQPPSASTPPAASAIIDNMVAARSPAVTLRLYGHTHEYHHLTSYGENMVVDGNAGAPLATTFTAGEFYGFAIIDQNSDGSITFTSYQVGSPPMVMDTWSVNANGTRHP